ncbi:MAG: hypothetical protein WDO18_21585 [Acidobacteriota bacterium]
MQRPAVQFFRQTGKPRTGRPTPGIKDFTNWINFFKARAWYDLIPDQNHSVVTAGYGTYQAHHAADP